MPSRLYPHCYPFLFLFLQLLFIYLLIPPVYASNGACYWIDGTVANSLFPCFTLENAGASMCCQHSQCQLDGLCNQTISMGLVSFYYWRGACSDSTWQDPACYPIAFWITNGQAQITTCPDGTICPRSVENDNHTCCTNGLGQIPALGDITVPLAVIQAIQASAHQISPSTPTSSPVSAPSGVGISENTSVSTVTPTAFSPSTITVIEMPTLGAQTPSQSATGDQQAQSSPPRSLVLPLGLGLGLAMPLFIGTGILVQYMRNRAWPQASANKQEQVLGGVQSGEEMDADVGRFELSPGMSEEARGWPELEGR